MAISKIQYDDKVAINIDSTIPDINKCNASDLNEIKSVVNNNADEIPTPDNLVNVGTSVDTDYKTNILTTKNLIPTNTNIVSKYTFNTSGSWVSNANYLTIGDENTLIKIEPNTTYTFTSDVDINKYLLARIYNFTLSKTWISRSDAITITSNGFSFTTGSTTEYISIGLYTNGTASSGDLTKCQLEEGSTATTYEAFIPNTINVNNEKYTDTINVGTEINNKNRVNMLYSHNLYYNSTPEDIFKTNFTDFSYNIINSNSLSFTASSTYTNIKTCAIVMPLDTTKIKPNTTYTLSCSSSVSGVSYTNAGGIRLKIGNDYGSVSTNNTLSFTTPSTITTISILFYLAYSDKNTTGTSSITFSNIMLVEGNEAQDYEPYIVPSINVDGEEIYNANLMNYSTNEVVVGKWIDGRNVYRQIIKNTSPSVMNTWKDMGTIDNLDIVINVNNIIIIGDNEKYVNNVQNVNFYWASNKVRIRCSSEYWINKDMIMILEYVKTTD